MKLIDTKNFDLDFNCEKLKFDHNGSRFTITEDIEGGIRINKIDQDIGRDAMSITPAYSNEIIIK